MYVRPQEGRLLLISQVRVAEEPRESVRGGAGPHGDERPHHQGPLLRPAGVGEREQPVEARLAQPLDGPDQPIGHVGVPAIVKLVDVDECIRSARCADPPEGESGGPHDRGMVISQRPDQRIVDCRIPRPAVQR
jgi:hypothetical protein